MVKLLIDKGAKLGDAALFHPFEKVNFQIIKYLLKRGANPKETDRHGNTLLHKQCERGNLKSVKYLIQHCNADVSAKNRQGQTPLHLACKGLDVGFPKRNYLKVVKFLIEEQNADPAVTCNEGKSSLHYAAEKTTDLKLLTFLIEEQNADPVVTSNKGKSSLHYTLHYTFHYTAENKYGPSILRYLIEDQQLDIEATDSEGRTALHIVCQSDYLFVLKWSTQKYLIEDHAKIIEAKDKKGKQALYYCLDNFVKEEKYEFDNFTPIALILATKANILKKQENKDTDQVFDWIKQSYDNNMKKSRGEDDAVSCLNAGLQSFQKQLDKKDQVQIEYNPLLLLVCYCNTVDIAKYMFNQDLCYIEKHFNAEEANSKRKLLLESYLKFSGQNGLLNLISFLFQEIKNRQEYFQHLNFEGSFLRSACINKHIDIFKYLLEDEETKDEAAEFLKDYPLHFTCNIGSLEMVQFLIETKQMDIEEQDNGGRTPLHCACLAGSIEIVKYLIETQNANLNTTDNKECTLWYFACQSKCLELVKYISQKTKQDGKAQDKDGSTVLHLACKWGNLKIVKFLINDMKANLELFDKQGRTPLHVSYGVQISKVLVNKGASILAKDKFGKSPFQMAKSETENRKKKKLIAFLKAATKR
jgi:ankyrin repeat protein